MSWKMRQLRKVGPRRHVHELDALVERTPPISGGQLMGYLFRRFGYPEMGWDGHKEIGGYYLSTPDRRLALGVRLTASQNPCINLRFLATPELYSEVGNDRFHQAWWGGFLPWIEENHPYPNWFDGFVRWVAGEDGQAAPDEVTVEDRRDALLGRAFLYQNPQGGHPEIAAKAGALYKHLRESYTQAHPVPPYPDRQGYWRRWPESDPLKKVARAAQVALDELRRPVRVRDGAIDAYGKSADSKLRAANEAKAAGYAPFGTFTNVDPELACELASAVSACGKGERRAMQEAIRILRETRRTPRRKPPQEGMTCRPY